MVVHFFFGHDVNTTKVHDIAKQNHIPWWTIHVLRGVKDTEYPPVRKNTAMLIRAAALATQHNYGWVFKVDDDTLINVPILAKVVLRLDPSKSTIMGRRGWGDATDQRFLRLAKPYCMGGPGYLMSVTALHQIVAHLPACVRQAEKSAIHQHLWHSDVVIGTCFLQHLNLGCWESDPKSSYVYFPKYSRVSFYHNNNTPLTWSSVVMNTLSRFAITLHPLKTKSEMKMVYQKIQTRVEVNRLAHKDVVGEVVRSNTNLKNLRDELYNRYLDLHKIKATPKTIAETSGTGVHRYTGNGKNSNHGDR